jgi:hypothetical protein
MYLDEKKNATKTQLLGFQSGVDLESLKMRVTHSFEKWRTTCPVTQRHIPEERIPSI